MSKFETIDTLGALVALRISTINGWDVVYSNGTSLAVSQVADAGHTWSLATTGTGTTTTPPVDTGTTGTTTGTGGTSTGSTTGTTTTVPKVLSTSIIFDSKTGFQGTYRAESFGVLNGGNSVVQTNASGNKVLFTSLNQWGACNVFTGGTILNSGQLGKLSFYLTISKAATIYLAGVGQPTYSIPTVAPGVRTLVTANVADFVRGPFTNYMVCTNTALDMTIESVSVEVTDGKAVDAAGSSTPVIASDPTTITAPTVAAPASAMVTGYYTTYNSSSYPPEAIEWSLLSHVIVTRLVANGDGSIINNYDYGTAGRDIAKKVVALGKAAGKPVSVMIGGSANGTAFATAINSAHRDIFLKNILAEVDSVGYSGINIDLEPIPSAVENDFIYFVKMARAARPNMLITVPTDWTTSSLAIAAIEPYCTELQAMSYQMADSDMSGWVGWLSWFYSAVGGDTTNHPSSISKTMTAYGKNAKDKSKYSYGIGTYCSAWTGVTGPNQSTTSAKIVAGDNSLGYNTLMSKYASTGTASYDAVAKAPSMTFATGKGPSNSTWVTYMSPQSIADAGAWMKANGFRPSCILWDLAQQYMGAAYTGEKNPLLKAAHDATL